MPQLGPICARQTFGKHAFVLRYRTASGSERLAASFRREQFISAPVVARDLAANAAVLDTLADVDARSVTLDPEARSQFTDELQPQDFLGRVPPLTCMLRETKPGEFYVANLQHDLGIMSPLIEAEIS